MSTLADSEWAARLQDPKDDAAWSYLVSLVEETAHRVRGGSRFDADDIVSLVLERIATFPDRELAPVMDGSIPLRVKLIGLVRNALFDLTRHHHRECRHGRETSLDGVGDLESTTVAFTGSTRLMTWSEWCDHDVAVLYRLALQAIHAEGPGWGVAAPYYPMLLLCERSTWACTLTSFTRTGALEATPADAAQQMVGWSEEIGRLPLGSMVLEDAARLPADIDDEALAAALHREANTLQQWRSRARAKVLSAHGWEWVQEHLPHWPRDPVIAPRISRNLP